MPFKIRISNSDMFSIYVIVTVTFLNVYVVEGEWAFFKLFFEIVNSNLAFLFGMTDSINGTVK